MRPRHEVFSLGRRIAVTVFSLCVGCVLFRSQIGGELVARGDALLIQGQSRAAFARYERAIWFDRDSADAVDRYAIAAIESRSRGRLASAVGITTAFLAEHPRAFAILKDRALCRLLSRDYLAAFFDFSRVASATRDTQAYVFAGWAARRSGRLGEAKKLFISALHFMPRYRPAEVALERMKCCR